MDSNSQDVMTQSAVFATKLMTGFTLFSMAITAGMFGLARPTPALRPVPVRRPARRR
ncbi:hypothetical protein NK718_17250 [Alsobacter sp. SYSU M60028]|uniref:Uncharacterized protein n=1 Tax=Alsobacter ponti TaxID=2962936 RepID=A0ABT1LFK1_9HYPH|nr:hypothetical protein [Alsobacter ponti]MCP8940275.1 hypothetical protein [Alsobacter ponti]